MHLVYICNEYPPYPHGGIGILYQTLARSLVKAGLRVSIVGTYRVKKLQIEEDMGVSVYRIPAVTIPGPLAILNTVNIQRILLQIHRNNPIDLLEASELGLGLISKQMPGIKIIRMSGGHHFFSITLGQRIRFWRGLLERLSFSKADALCAVSRFVGETTSSILNLHGRAIEVLPNPVDTNIFRPRLNMLEEPKSILFVGTVTEKKGICQLIDAMARVNEAVPGVHLNVVGRDAVDKESGKSYVEYLKTRIPPSLSDSIHFVGPVQNVEISDWIARSAVCVYPSHMEAQGIVVIEGMASGKAVVASQTGPGPELITDGQEGFLCDPYSPESIAEKVILFMNDLDLRYRLGLNARARAEREFSVDVMVQKNIEFYQRCLS